MDNTIAWLKLLDSCVNLIDDYPEYFTYKRGTPQEQRFAIFQPKELFYRTTEELQSLLTHLVKKANASKGKPKPSKGKKQRKPPEIGSGMLFPYEEDDRFFLAEALITRFTGRTRRRKVIDTQRLFTRPYQVPDDPIPYTFDKKQTKPTVLIRSFQTEYQKKYRPMYELLNQFYTMSQYGLIKTFYFETMSGLVSPIPALEEGPYLPLFTSVKNIKGPLLMITCGCAMSSLDMDTWNAVKNRLTILTHYSYHRNCNCRTFSDMHALGFNLIHEIV